MLYNIVHMCQYSEYCSILYAKLQWSGLQMVAAQPASRGPWQWHWRPERRTRDPATSSELRWPRMQHLCVLGCRPTLCRDDRTF